MRWARWADRRMAMRQMAVAAGLAALAGAAGDLPGLPTQDHRVPVDGAAAPWRAVARLNVTGVARCTAVLVAPRRALTAAHCLWNRRLDRFAPAGSVHVLTQYRGGDFAGHAVALRVVIAPGYDPRQAGGDPADDVAVLTLDSAPGRAWLTLAEAPPRPGTPAMLGGYNQDHAERIDADTDCHVTAAAPRLLAHDCAGTHGTSGGPLLVRGTGGVWRLAGLQVQARIGAAGGVAVAAAVLHDRLAAEEAPP